MQKRVPRRTGNRFTPTRVGKTDVVVITRLEEERFTPTRVGKTLSFALVSRFQSGSPPRVWGKRPGGLAVGVVVNRFTPTRVGKTTSLSHDQQAAFGSPPRVWGKRQFRPHQRTVLRGSPPRVWGKRPTASSKTADTPVHPHACGENEAGARGDAAGARFTPTRVGKTGAQVGRPRFVGGSPPRVWGKHPSGILDALTTSVHPHACGENLRFLPL